MPMKVSAYAHPRWFESPGEEDLRFLKQVGIDLVDISLGVVGSYRETGEFTSDELARVVDRLDAVGLRIERVTAGGRHLRDALLGKPGGQGQVDKLCKATELLGQAGVPVMFFPGLAANQLLLPAGAGSGEGFFPGQYAGQIVDSRRPGWSERPGRGGYISPGYDHQAAQAAPYDPPQRVTTALLWERLLWVYRQVMPVAERAGVLLAQHGVDPPVPLAYGNPQVLTSFADFDRLFAEVPSPNNGMTFCVGTRYESGEDVLEGIRHFGGQGRIFHVHFRNVRGTIPRDRGYTEAFIDDGDLRMRDVLLALHEVGYGRALDYDHVVRTVGDSFLGRQYVAFAVGYIKGLLAGLG